MKFTQLPIGARFRYQGRLYSKTSPLAASAEDGAQRLIPRSATVQPAEPTSEAAPSAPHDRRAALDDYHASCVALLGEVAEAGPSGLQGARTRLDEAYRALLARLG
jgi:hypothetical protein